MALQTELDTVKNQNTNLTQQLGNLQIDADVGELKDRLEGQIEQLNETVSRLTRELEESKLSVGNLQNVLESYEAEKASENEILLLEWKRKSREDSATISNLKNELSTFQARL